MNMSEFIESGSWRNYLIASLVGGVIVALVFVFIIKPSSPASTVTQPTTSSTGLQKVAGTSSATLLPSPVSDLIIDVSGAVNRPGVYKLPTGSRLGEAVDAAGGVNVGQANAELIEKSINLAQKLTDGQKVYVPFKNDTTIIGAAAAGSSVAANSGPIGINSASNAELDVLPGVGPATAAKIIAGRPYSSIEDLVTKKAVGQSVFDNIKGLISL